MEGINQRPHILIVDDEEIIRDLVADILDESGYCVTGFSSGEEALIYYRNNIEEIDLVLLDIIMPEMNGAEVFQRLREYRKDVKIILLSGYSRDEDVEEILSAGNSDFMQKPISMKLLLEVIGKWI